MICDASGGKIRHATRDDARRHADALRRKRGKRDSDVYPCPHGCGGWHVTTRSRAVLSRRIRRALRRGHA